LSSQDLRGGGCRCIDTNLYKFLGKRHRFMLDLGMWFAVAWHGTHSAPCHTVRALVVLA
jgi:hypothetical protein